MLKRILLEILRQILFFLSLMQALPRGRLFLCEYIYIFAYIKTQIKNAHIKHHKTLKQLYVTLCI